ncbi:MAG: YqeG family HAD IIIA-type phosphatase [Armatimonadota bacterium]|nr:YqeG family HAD IIIA-type phosphatase [Armatimonadota bacterium]
MIRRILDLCRPDESVSRVTDIDLDRLMDKGFKALLLDLDNTLLPWQSMEVPADVRRWVNRAVQLGFRLCIVSNTHNPRRLRQIAAEIGVECVHRALKPRGSGFTIALAKLGCAGSEAVVVGDQLLTDILGGKLAGMYTILVDPMHPREFVGTKISRLIERFLGRKPAGNKGRTGSVSKKDTR